ncbi:MAG: phosphatase PAP2 family protein [Bacteroidales bacterium]|nr:phosphatase PAP2 family protein [Bacteroidales bacterium]RLD38715.1 MAG: phosphatase PAP2 family protein [Bacteroidota bacterium]
MLDFLTELDKQVFLVLNSFHNGFFDFLMWWFSNKLIWIPFYIFLLYLLIKKYGWESIVVLLSLALLIVLSDQISGFIKDAVARYRPSHNPDIQEQVHVLNNYLGGNYGFVSSHAANSFALAYFLVKFLKANTVFTFLLFSWAIVVSYSRIYLGVHYPGDIIGGAILGVVLAWFIANIYRQLISRFFVSKLN